MKDSGGSLLCIVLYCVALFYSVPTSIMPGSGYNKKNVTICRAAQDWEQARLEYLAFRIVRTRAAKEIDL